MFGGKASWFAVVCIACVFQESAAFNFLVMSAPRNAKVSYVKIPESGILSPDIVPQLLIGTGLQHPQGVAVDQKRKRLFVADPDVQKIYAYTLVITGDTLATDGQQVVLSQNSESRWVAVDGVGNVFFSNEPESKIMKVSASRVLRGDPSPEVVYNGAGVAQVSRPGGIAVDNFHVYWTNKLSGTQVGSVVKGDEMPIEDSGSISVLAKNTARSYGVCTALNNIFYTDSAKNIFGVKKSGGPIAAISGKLTQPRGCVWDGDGTVYVADKGGNAIFSFAGNMHSLSPVQLTKVIEFEDAFGLAVISAAAGRHLVAVPAVLAVLVLAVLSQGAGQ